MIQLPIPNSKMSTYLSIKEAADKAGKAEITIRRYVQSIVKDLPKSDERQMIQPTIDEVKELKKKKKPFSWQISEELIVQKFAEEAKAARAKKQDSISSDVLNTLQTELGSKQDQLQMKDKQIEALTEIVQSLNERMREGNVLMASLQKHLALPEAGADKKRWWKLGK